MMVLKVFLLFINILSFTGVIIILPLGIYDFFAGREKADALLQKAGFNYNKIEVIFIILLAISFLTYIIRKSIFS